MVAQMASNKAEVGTEEDQPTAEDQRQQQEQQPSGDNDEEADPNKGNDAEEMKEETIPVTTEDGNLSKRRKVEGLIPSKVAVPTTDASPSPPPPSSSSSSPSPPIKAAPATIQTKTITTTTTTTVQQQQKQQPTTMAAASDTSDMEVDEYTSDLGLTSSSDEEDTPDARAGRLCSNLEGLLKVRESCISDDLHSTIERIVNIAWCFHNQTYEWLLKLGWSSLISLCFSL